MINIKITLSFFVTILCLCHYNLAETSFPIEDIQSGMGYSTDTGSIASNICYQPTSVTTSDQQAMLNLAYSINSEGIMQAFNGLFNEATLFSADGISGYMNKLREDDYSLSLHYYSKASQTKNMEYAKNNTLLTDLGKQIYQDGQNPDFRILCGDILVSSYEEGAVLIVSLQIRFDRKWQKERFKNRVGTNLGALFATPIYIQRAIKSLHISGSLEIHAFQKGGDPNQLAELLSSSITTCRLDQITICQPFITKLSGYAQYDFPDQFTKNKGTWISPLEPLGSFSKYAPVSIFGLNLTRSFADGRVFSSRQKLITSYNKLVQVQRNLKALIELYPAPFQSSHTLLSVQKNLNATEKNINLFLTGINGTGVGAALDCWRLPNNCSKISSSLLSEVTRKPLKPPHETQFIFCDDPLIFFPNPSDNPCLYGQNAQFYKGNFFNNSKLPEEDGWCYAWAQILVEGKWENCSKSVRYLPDTSFQYDLWPVVESKPQIIEVEPKNFLPDWVFYILLSAGSLVVIYVVYTCTKYHIEGKKKRRQLTLKEKMSSESYLRL